MKTSTEKFWLALPYVAFFVSMIILFSVLSMMNRGVDLTDEGYYLNWISNPWIYKYYTSQFGYMYHPLFNAVGGSLQHLRESSLLISFTLSWLLCYNILKLKFTETPLTHLILLSACLALPSLFTLTIAGRWVPTPSYNSLNFQGCVFTMLGITLVTRNIEFSKVIGAILIGLGGWVVFMAKPSTALLLSAACLIYLLTSIKSNKATIALAGATALLLLLVTALVIDHSPLQFLHRLEGGVKLMYALAAGHGLGSIFRWDPLKIKTAHLTQFLLLTVIAYLAFEMSSFKKFGVQHLIALLSSLLLAYSLFEVVFSPSKMVLAPKYHTLALASLILGLLISQLRKAKIYKLKEHPIGLFILFTVLPYAYASGSGNNYWFAASNAIIFWLIAAILMIHKPVSKHIQLVVMSCCVIAFVAYGITTASNTPYRQSEAVKLQNSIINDPATHQNLLVTSDTATYIGSLKMVLSQHKFVTGTPIIDLTGHHPGSLYYVGAKAIGQAWMIGGYKGSNQLASLTLQQFSCQDLANAWLITEPLGQRAIALEVLTGIGLKVDPDYYQEVGRVETQTVFDMKKSIPSRFEQMIYKPISQHKQQQQCEARRKDYAHLMTQP